MNLRANVYIDACKDGDVFAHREVHNVLCNTGRLFALRRLMGTVGATSYGPINVFAVGDQGTDPLSGDLPIEAEPTQWKLNHEILRAEIDNLDCSTSPVDPNADPTQPIYLTITSSVNSTNVASDITYVNTLSEAGIASCPTTGTSISDASSYLLVYTTFSEIPFARAEDVSFNVTWSIYVARET